MNGYPKEFLTRQVEQRSADLGRQVLGAADSLHRIAQQLRQDELAHRAADLADGGAAMIERFGRYLQESDFDQLVSDAEEFGRERPLAVAAAGLVAGFVASRMLKASAAQRHTLLNERGSTSNGRRRGRAGRRSRRNANQEG